MNNPMAKTKRGGVFFAVLVLAAALFMPEGGWAERPTDPGGGPPSGKGRKPPEPGGTTKGDILGDLWVVVRNVETGGNGAPIHFTWQWPQEYYDETGALVIPEGGLPTGYTSDEDSVCVQPISFNPIDPAPMVTETGEEKQYTYEYVNSYGNPITVYLIPLDAECNIPDVYAGTWGTQVSEVDSGRLALARTTQYVIDAAYEEALNALNDATSVTLGPAGRLQIVPLGAPERIIDSPRENLALYQRVMKDGCLSPTANVSLTNGGIFGEEVANLLCPNPYTGPQIPDKADLQTAASFLAGAADKTGDIGIDEVVYLNTILGINTVETSATDGSLIVTGYFDFGYFQYHRNATYDSRQADLLQPPLPPGDYDETGYPKFFNVNRDFKFAGSVFGQDTAGFTIDWDGTVSPYSNYPVINFVRAADDAVSVIFYIHNYELPVYPVPIEAAPTPPMGPVQPGNTLQLQFRGPAPLR